ncbi:MAG: hypothetical protein KGQ60_14535 [Planctomycetes bacterium]|nr:hypothetical protein [Planctomycetota bacterium]
MTETLLGSETDEIVDAKNFSGLSLVGLLLAIVGSFSLAYVQMLPIAILAVVIGAVVLLLAKRKELSGFSQFLGMLAIFLGAGSGALGVFSRSLATQYDVEQAKAVSAKYLENVAKWDEDVLLLLNGVTLEKADSPNKTSPESTEGKVRSKIENDPIHMEIRSRKTAPKWVYAGLDGEFPSESGGYVYKLRFIDQAQTNPPSYWVYARKNCPKGGPAQAPQNKGRTLGPNDLVVHWYIDSIESAQKL